MTMTRAIAERSRVAVLSVHTSPVDQPGTGDSGGMNVYIREVAERLAARGVGVDVFTRSRSGEELHSEEIAPGARVVRIDAGPPTPIPKHDLPRLLPRFLGGVLDRARTEGRRYDLVHSHYWLSGWVGRSLTQIWETPLVSSFHTLGKVKNYSLANGEPPEPASRLSGETSVIASSDRILAPTPAEAAHLVGLYGADGAGIRVVPPGVDHALFSPRDAEAAKQRLHLTRLRLVLFVGRLQTHKGPDIAIRTLAEAVAREPERTRDVVLAVVGGPSGGLEHGADVARLLDLATALGVGERVMFFPPQEQARLADFYAAADALLVPSRSESFGLVALEAQACGTPVIAAAVGGLRYIVHDGVTGRLVPGHDPADHADRLLSLLADEPARRVMGDRALRASQRFSWDATARAVLDVYGELVPRPVAASP
ncbi:MAG: D-inositol-3-phosphate glycosyltransferase [Actinomycetota bacterium]